MNEILSMIESNILMILYAYAMFACAFLANILFRLQYDIRHVGHVFKMSILIDEIFKALSIVAGTLLLVLMVNLFTPLTGMNQDWSNLVNIASLISTIGRGTISYSIEAYTTFQDIMAVPTKASKDE